MAKGRKKTNRTYSRINYKEIAEALGAKIITDPKEIAKMKEKFRRRP